MRLTATRSSITSGGGAVLDAIQQEEPTLDLNFEETKTLTDDVSGDNLVTFTRASSGTYVDSAGLIQTAATDTPRFDHDPATLESLGLLIEEARTNYCKDGTGFTVTSGNGRTQPINGTFSSTTVVNPTGAASTTLFTTDVVSGADVQIFGGDSTLGSVGNAMSMFIKPNGITKIFLTTYTNAGNQGAYFELTGNGSVVGVENNLPTDQYFIDPYPNGWYRIGVRSTGGTPSYRCAVWEYDGGNNPQWTSVSGDGVSGFYIWGWQNELGEPYWSSVIPTSGSTVTRAADVAEITGANFAKTNLVQYSERFDNTVWLKNASSGTLTYAPNITTAPDGSLTADSIAAVSAGSARLQQQFTTITSGQTYTASIYVKHLSGGSSFTIWAVNAAQSSTLTATSEWQRFSFTFTATATSDYIRFIQFGSSDSEFAVWGAQLEEGSVLTTYTPSVESFDSRASTATYVDGSGVIQTAAVDEARYENGELLLEEARTNLLTYSEEFDQSAWTGDISGNGVSPTVTPNQAIAPDGTVTADRIDFSRGDSLFPNYSFISSASVSTTAGSLYSGSLWVKAATSQDVGKSLVLRHVSGGAGIIHTLTADWTRINETETAASSTGKLSFGLIGYDPSSFGSQVQPETSLSVYVWGAQLEAGSYPTSYIPTSGTTVTRAADVSTSALGVDSWYNQEEGTVFVDSPDFPNYSHLSNGAFVYISDGNVFSIGTGDGIKFGTGSPASGSRVIVTEAGVNEADSNNVQASKFAIAVAENNFSFTSDGVTRGTDTSVTMPTGMDRLAMTAYGPGYAHIKRLAYFNTRLPDATLQNITS